MDKIVTPMVIFLPVIFQKPEYFVINIAYKFT
jgi:hypothetical protein